MPAESSPPAELRRAIRLPHATAMVAGTIIGASIFVQPSQVTGQVPSFTGAALVWLLAGGLTLMGALVTAELASAYPQTGGVYVYLREAFGPLSGFLWGWAMFWTMHTGIIAAIAMVMASYVGFLAEIGPRGQRIVAIAAVAALSWINYLGVRHGSLLQTAITVVKVAVIVLMVTIGLALGSPEAVTRDGTDLLGGGGLSGLLSGLAAGLFAFGGWHMVTYNAGETVEPARTIPRSLVLGVLIVTVCYVALNGVYFCVLAGPRVYFAMAQDGSVFSWVGALHPRHRTPHRAILLQAIWAAVLIWTGTYRQLFTRVIYTEWIFFGAMALGLIVLRRRGAKPEYLVPIYPALPIVFAASAFAVAVHEILADPAGSLQGLGLVALGAPVFYIWTRRSHAGPNRGAAS